MSVTSLRGLLFALLGGSVAWAVHFLGSYVLVAVGCAMGWGGMRAALAVATLALAAVAGAATWLAFREWRSEAGVMPWDVALSETHSWRAFLMLSGILLGALATGTILLEGFASLAVPLCSRSGAG
ncbi:MAG TPA: hypothetical protein VFY20_11150 [Gemmatimonadales bacterium]|nr:hypothetical protein [Gemmatimonadales bacterium]